MKRLLIFWTFFVLTNFVNGQDVIDLNLLAAKKVKSTVYYSVSDNTIDFKGIKHDSSYSVTFIGAYSRSLHVKNFVGGQIIYEATITTNTSDKTLKFTDCKDFKINGEKAFLYGSGNNSGAMLWVTGKWQNCHLVGFYIDQSRNKLSGETTGGPAVQFESYSDPLFNHGKLKIEKTVVRNANDESFYILYTRAQKGYLDSLIITGTDVENTGRDFWQFTNVRNVLIENNRGANGGLERNGDHISGFSANEKNANVIIRNNVVTNTPQFAFSGGGGKTLFENNTFQQENAPGGNQGLYLRDGEFILKGNWFNAVNSVRSVIGIDKSKLTWDVSNTFVGKQPFFLFTGSTLTEVPVILKESGLIEIEKTSTGQKVFVLYNGDRIQIK
jgi:hypothetical protein